MAMEKVEKTITIDLRKRPFIEGREELEWCGPAIVAYVAGLFGIESSQRTLAKEIYDPTWGTSGENLQKGFALCGLESRWVQNRSLAALEHQREAGDEIILSYLDDQSMIEIGGRIIPDGGHFGGLRLYSAPAGIVAIDDPSWPGRITLFRSKDFVEKLWRDYGEHGEVLKHWALIVRKPTTD